MEKLSFKWLEKKEGVKKIRVIESKGKQEVYVHGHLYMRWSKGDEIAPKIAIAQLYKCGLCTQEELSEGFGVAVKTVYNYSRALNSGGIGNLIGQRSGPKEKWKLQPEVRAKILIIALGKGIKEYADIQKKIKEYWRTEISLPSIREVLVENGLVKESGTTELPKIRAGEFFEEIEAKGDQEQTELGFDFKDDNNNEEALSSKEIKKYSEITIDSGKRERSEYSRVQRIYLDQLEQGVYNSYAGGWLFVPLLKQYNYLSIIKNIINIESYEGYSLEELCLTLFYFDLFRFESMENFKTVYSEEFGQLIGRTLSPSIYTLRRFLHKVKDLSKSEELIDEFAREYLRAGLARWGVLYIDGHFLPYYGIYCISMGWHGVRKVPMKGSYNFIATDEKFNPLLFLIRSSSEDLVEKIPEIILKAKKIAREVGINETDIKNLIIIFDREGYSAELYRKLDGQDSDNGKYKVKFISWAKYSDKWVDDIEDEKFDKTVTVAYEIQKPEEVKYFDTERNMNKYGKIRAIVIESKRGRAAIYTNDKEISADIIIQLICRRWGEENLIKALIMKHQIDYSPGYEARELETQPLVDNPKTEELKQKRTLLKSELSNIKSKFGHDVLEEMNKEKKWENIKKKHLGIIADIESLNAKIALLDLEIDKIPEKVKFDEANGEKLYEFNYEKKRFLDCLKVFTYNIEKQMCQILLNYYDVQKEIYPALAMILKRGGLVKLEDGKLKIKLSRFRNPEIDYAARHLCENLNKMGTVTLDKFHLPIHFEVI